MLRIPNSFVARESLGAISWNFVGMTFSLLTGVITARILAPDDRGVLALFLIFSSISYLFSSLGTNSAIRTFQPREEWASFRVYFQVSGFLLLVNIVVSCVVFLAFSRFSAEGIRAYFWFFVLLSICNFISSQLLDVLNAVGQISSSAFANISGHFATMSVLVVFFTLFPGAGLRGVTGAYIAGFFVRILMIVGLLCKSSVQLGFSSARGRSRLLKSGLGFWGMGLGQTLTFRADQLLLGFLSNPLQVGLYAVATTPASLMQVVSNSIGQVAFRQAATNKLTSRSLAKFVGFSTGITSGYVLVLWVVAPVLIPFVFGSDYAESANIVRILLLAELFLSPYLVLVRVLAGLNQPNWASASGFVGLAVLIPCSMLLIPLHGAHGAAWGAVIGYATMFMFTGVGALLSLRDRRFP